MARVATSKLIFLLILGLASPSEAGRRRPKPNVWIPSCQEVELTCEQAGFERELCCIPDGETVETACHGLVNRVDATKPSACPGRLATRCVASKPGMLETDHFTEFERFRPESCYAPEDGDVTDVSVCADPTRRLMDKAGCQYKSVHFGRRWIGMRCTVVPSPDTADGFALVDREAELPCP